MNRVLLFAISILSGVFLFAQKSNPGKGYVIEGRLSNFSANQVFIVVDKPKGGYLIDTAAVDKSGSFYYKNEKLTSPTMARLVAPKILNSDLFLAPGYHLNFSGNAQDYISFSKTKKISGIGSESNRYLVARDSILTVRRDTISWYEMNGTQLLAFIKKDQVLKDSLYNAVFSVKSKQDKYLSYFKHVSMLDDKFMRLYYLISYASEHPSLSYEESVSFVKSNFDNQILNDLYRKEYLVSPGYCGWLMNTYPFYLRDLECKKDSNYCKGKNEHEQLVSIIADNYKGEIREMILFHKLDNKISFCRSYEELSANKPALFKYMALLRDEADRTALNELLKSKEAKLGATKIGQQAPVFTAEDSSGTTHSLADYKGKVIYLDLWASWCAPCRAEAPHLKEVIEKYKNEERVAFISVAVADKTDKWKEALEKDQPAGLQLFDREGSIQSAYSANSIPKFILISKKGNIVFFDAPLPSSGSALEKVLNEEIGK